MAEQARGAGTVDRAPSSVPASQNVRRATRVKAGDDFDRSFVYSPVIERVGKSPEESAAHVAMNQGEGIRHSSDKRKSSIESRGELGPESGTLLLIPVPSSGDIGHRLGTVEELQPLWSSVSRRRTSSQGTYSGRGSASLRSSSRRCHSGTGTASESAISSQISPRSSICSSIGRRRISSIKARFVMVKEWHAGVPRGKGRDQQ